MTHVHQYQPLSFFSLPIPVPLENEEKHRKSATTKLWRYLRRLFKVDQMDFEYALWQMMYLFVAPQKVYRNFNHRKNSKFQFARDDPAFLLLVLAWFIVLSMGFVLLYRPSLANIINFLFYTVIIDCIGSGCVIATIFWCVLNNLNLKKPSRYFDGTDDVIEWGYAFDVHLNALFPTMTIIHVCLLLLFNDLIIGSHWSFVKCLGNTAWLIAVSYYVYITFLGYNSLEILRRPFLLLTPLFVIVLVYAISLIGQFNIMHLLMKYYEKRIV